MDQDRRYYFDEEKNYNEQNTEHSQVEPPKRKGGGFTRFIVFTLIIAMIGGPLIGVGYRLASYYIDENEAKLEGYFFSTVDESDVNRINYVPKGEALSTVDIVNKVGDAVVAITSTVEYNFFNTLQQAEGQGSGIIFRVDGDYIYILTNNHVIADADELMVELSQNIMASAKVVGTDADADIAVIKVSTGQLTEETLATIEPVVFGDSDYIQVGEDVVAIGNPLGYNKTVTVGVVSALNRELRDTNSLELIQTDAAINPGNSGGALVNQYGEVIGINTIKISDTSVEGIGFAIPINDAARLLTEILEKGYVSKPYMGISGRTIDEELASAYDIPQGVLVLNVSSGSGSDEAGMKRGDVITAINGVEVLTIEELIDIIQTHEIGDTIEIVALRDETPQIFMVELKDANSK